MELNKLRSLQMKNQMYFILRDFAKERIKYVLEKRDEKLITSIFHLFLQCSKRLLSIGLENQRKRQSKGLNRLGRYLPKTMIGLVAD